MFYRDTDLQKEICKNYSDVEKEGWCNSFDVSFFSSNDPDSFKTKKGYVICENGLEHNIVPAYVSLYVADFGYQSDYRQD